MSIWKYFSLTFCFLISLGNSAEFELKILKVGQANFTLLSAGPQGIVFDCGSKEAGWVAYQKFTKAKELMLKALLEKITDLKIIISHNHDDHHNLFSPLVKLIELINVERDGKKAAKITYQKLTGWDSTITDWTSKLKGFLGNGVIITPLIANVTKGQNPIHDRCLVLKITTIGINPRSILLTGDASGDLLKAVMEKDKSAMDGIDVVMLSHHGSSREKALEWFEKASEGCKDRPLLSVISSDPSGKDSIPTGDTLIKLLENRNRPIQDLILKGQYFCSYHHIDGFSTECESVVTLPSFQSFTGSVLPIFITSKSEENDGDGIYRIMINSTGSVYMRNSALPESYQYIFISNPSEQEKKTLLGGYIKATYNALAGQKLLLGKCMKDLQEICATSVVEDLLKAREQFLQSGVFNLYFSTVEPLQTELAQQIRTEKRIKLVSSFAQKILENIETKIMLLRIKEVTDSIIDLETKCRMLGIWTPTKFDKDWVDFLYVNGFFNPYGVKEYNTKGQLVSFTPTKISRDIPRLLHLYVMKNENQMEMINWLCEKTPKWRSLSDRCKLFGILSSKAFNAKWVEFLLDKGLLTLPDDSRKISLARLLYIFLTQNPQNAHMIKWLETNIPDSSWVVKVREKAAKYNQALKKDKDFTKLFHRKFKK
jgi:beta-lactamase superfamily II metal-dependent hydrolase